MLRSYSIAPQCNVSPTMSVSFFYWHILVALTSFCSRCWSSQMDIVCHGGLRLNTPDRDAYVLDSVELPYLGYLRMTIVLPREWNLVYCCHRMEMTFTFEDLTRSARAPEGADWLFPVFARWSVCSPDLSHWLCVGVLANGPRDRKPDRSSRIGQGSWSLSLEQCLDPMTYVTSYDVTVRYQPVSDSNDIVYKTPNDKGNITVESFAARERNLPGAGTFARTNIVHGRFCTLSARLKPITNRWTILHENITLSTGTSLAYRFVYSLEMPTNLEVFRLYFIEAGLGAAPSAASNSGGTNQGHSSRAAEEACLADRSAAADGHFRRQAVKFADGRPGKADRRGKKSTSTPSGSSVGLTIANSWSGCRVENRAGLPTYSCEGGQTFRSPEAVTIALASCGRTASILVNYSFEFYGERVYGADCRSYGVRVGGAWPGSDVLVSLLVVVVVVLRLGSAR